MAIKQIFLSLTFQMCKKPLCIFRAGAKKGGKEALPPPQSTCLAPQNNKLTPLKIVNFVLNLAPSDKRLAPLSRLLWRRLCVSCYDWKRLPNFIAYPYGFQLNFELNQKWGDKILLLRMSFFFLVLKYSNKNVLFLFTDSKPGAYFGGGGHCAWPPFLTLPFSKQEEN